MFDGKRKVIDWERTAKMLRLLRCDNIALRKYVCRQLNVSGQKESCDGLNCNNCTIDMEASISQGELAQVFHVSEGIVANWENNRTNPELEDLLLYADICELSLYDIIQFEK